MQFSDSAEEKANSVPSSGPPKTNLMPEIAQAEAWCELAEAKKIAAQILMDEADALLWKAIAVYQRQLAFPPEDEGDGKAT
jgi:hypothetical protein